MSGDEYNEILDILELLKAESKSSFVPSDIQEHSQELQHLSSKQIEKVLLEIWRRENSIYQDGLGTDGTHLWCFGSRPFPDTRRRFIGKR